jgi:hypothetical protein
MMSAQYDLMMQSVTTNNIQQQQSFINPHEQIFSGSFYYQKEET